MPTYPDRIRLPRGRHTHAARFPPGYIAPVTACEPTEPRDDAEHHDGAPITCPACQRATES
ncbi:hypothetical protein ACFW9F_01360 [Streptomyces sp. NPDC059506]|uniref:hypothetical protein n=1 Tax=Streptomyces sp. NPDC059506 TaxID=3347751 RepID=UPI003681BDF6